MGPLCYRRLPQIQDSGSARPGRCGTREVEEQHWNRMLRRHASDCQHVLPPRTDVPDSRNQSSKSRGHEHRSVGFAICKLGQLLQRGRLVGTMKGAGSIMSQRLIWRKRLEALMLIWNMHNE